jgi:hypothetical protein
MLRFLARLYLPGRLRFNSRQDPQQGRLPDPVRANNGQARSLGDGERDA